VQNAVVRARNIFAKLEAQGHERAGPSSSRGAPAARELLAGEEGDEIWALLLLMAAQRGGRGAGGALRGRRHCSPSTPSRWRRAFHSYYQKPKYSVLYAETDAQRALRSFVVDAFIRQMEALTDLLGIPVPERM